MEEGEREAADSFFLLPLELVLRVALYLSPTDVTRCLLVCRAWYDRLSQLQPYWRVACATAGLSGSMVRKFGHLYGTPRGLFLATQNYLRGVSAPPPRTVNLTRGLPFNFRYTHQYAREGMIVGTIYKEFHPREMVVELVRGGRITRTHTLQLSSDRRSEHRMLWGSVIEGNQYICATAGGRWSLFDLSTSSNSAPLLPQLIWYPGYPLYDTNLRLTCCERCGLVAMVKLVSFHTVDEQSYWDIRFLRLAVGVALPSHLLQFKIYHKNRDIVGWKASNGKRWVWLISKTPPTSPGEGCSAHMLLLQWANSITSHIFSASNSGHTLTSPSPLLSLTIPTPSLGSDLYHDTGLNTEMVLSADSQLVGVVFQARLHVWEMWGGREISHAQLPVGAEFEQLRLLAVGHLLTVVGLQSSTDLLLVLTLTGGVVRRCPEFATRHSHMIPSYTELLCVNEEAWLSDISAPCTEQSVTFWNKTNRSLEAILLGEEPVVNGNKTPVLSSKRKLRWKFWE